MRAHAVQLHPNECCGIILGAGPRIKAIIPARNIHSDPGKRFEIDPHALIKAFRQERAGGPEVLGYYHSHPHGPAHPSATDAAQAAGDNRIWAIIAPGETTWWRDAPDGFTPLSLALADG